MSDKNGKHYFSPELGGRKFKLRPQLPRFAVMGLVAAQRSGVDERIMESMWRLTRALIDPEDWDALEEMMSADDELFDELDTFVEGCMGAYELGPTNESSDSSPSSTPMPTTSRVVSLEQGTVQVIDSQEIGTPSSI